MEFEATYQFPKGYDKFMDTEKLENFNIKERYHECIDNGLKGKQAVEESMDNHFEVIQESAKDMEHGFEILEFLQDHIEYRLKHYTKCISKSTDNYFKFLLETYNRQLSQKIRVNIDESELN